MKVTTSQKYIFWMLAERFQIPIVSIPMMPPIYTRPSKMYARIPSQVINLALIYS